MREQRTLILDEDAPTKVDFGRMRAAPREAPAASKSSSGSMSSRVQIVVGAALLLFLVGLLSVAWQERRNSRALRQILEELRRDRAAMSLSERPAPAVEAAHRRHREEVWEAAPDPSTMESRWQLETKAATALLAHDYPRALSLYRALARVSSDPVFADAVAILEARVRCGAEHEGAGDPCP